MAHRPERTCIGCRVVFGKDKVVRVIAGPVGPIIDYREKLPGRAAYICPRRACIENALSKNALSRALRVKVTPQSAEQFIADLAMLIRQKIASLLSMATKAGMTVSGFSAVEDALLKSRIKMLLFAIDIADGTKNKILSLNDNAPDKICTIFTKEELGGVIGREQVGVVGIIEKGFSDAIWREAERLKGLLNACS